jgi:hypothetical protein
MKHATGLIWSDGLSRRDVCSGISKIGWPSSVEGGEGTSESRQWSVLISAGYP